MASLRFCAENDLKRLSSRQVCKLNTRHKIHKLLQKCMHESCYRWLNHLFAQLDVLIHVRTTYVTYRNRSSSIHVTGISPTPEQIVHLYI